MPADAPSSAETLAALRQRIDAVDTKLLEAVTERAQIAKLVGETKLAADPDAGGQPVHRPGREAALLRSLIGRYEGPMNRLALHAVWRELIGASIAIQGPLTVATDDTTTEMAARLHFGASQSYLWAASPIAAVASREADVALFDIADVESWQAADALLGARDDCALLWRLPFTLPGGRWVAIGRGIAEDSGIDHTVAYCDGDADALVVTEPYAAAWLTSDRPHQLERYRIV